MQEIKIHSRTDKFIMNNTPFKYIEIGDYTIKLFWTKGGLYGQQVQVALYKSSDVNFNVKGYKTTGCGYCKESHALEKVFKYIGMEPEGHTFNGSLSHDFHVGGNYYKVNKFTEVK